MFMEMSASEVFGAQQGREHVERHTGGGDDVDYSEDHGSDSPEQDGVDAEQREQSHAGHDIDKVHGSAPILELPMYRAPASRVCA
jgi:hypothetical protein